MVGFETDERGRYGRIGRIETPSGPVTTPAFFPVLNFISGTTTDSGGVWRYARTRLLADDRFEGALFQAMNFLDYDSVTPEQLADWTAKPMCEHYPEFTEPLFVDSGGFKLMNTRTFGEPPEAGGETNEWGVYTDPESILNLQIAYGADVVATLDFPIPPDLNDAERDERLSRSIDSAIECLSLVAERDADPAVYVAVHGHDYETINWYVSRVLDRAAGVDADFHGFAVGSLVPFRNNHDTLVDIIQGARDAIPAARRDDLGLHVFGVGGRLLPLLALLGVDSFDSSTYIQAAKFKKFLRPTTWRKVEADDVDFETWDCTCPTCSDLDFDRLQRVLYADASYRKIDGAYKSEFYAAIAAHNFQLFRDEVDRTRAAIADDRLLEYTATVAREIDDVGRALERAQVRDTDLREALAEAGHD
ncbi:hypothetical protein BRD17_04320, partial [Halobacteriales archaeon SW_7_68_16]